MSDSSGTRPPQDGAGQSPLRRMAEGLGNWREAQAASRPTLGAQLDASFRELAKDLRQTANEVFFSAPEHAPEIGAPGNPTQAMTTADLMRTGIYGAETPDRVSLRDAFGPPQMDQGAAKEALNARDNGGQQQQANAHGRGGRGR